MSFEKLMLGWKKKQFKPVYWLEGAEPFFIDEAINYAEHQILTEAEAGFNLTVFYGKDADWAQVVNACRRYPMFAERQVVLIKEAQQMSGVEKLEGYVENPTPHTVLVAGMKEKTLDGRSRMAKLLKEKDQLYTFKKMRDGELPGWVNMLVGEKGFAIAPKANQLLVDHIGNDLSRLNNELNKVLINVSKERQNITEDDIEQYVGISKEYNLFELQAALMQRNLPKALRIIQYFESNPKAAPIQMILPTLHGFFAKTYMLFGLATNDDGEAARTLGVGPYFVKDYRQAAGSYQQRGVENALLLLHDYNLKSIGIGSTGVSDASLMKEMIVKMILA
jgi:DNA polymerase III subunit delta